MNTNRKENMPPWPEGHLKSGRQLVQKNVSFGLSVGDGRDTMTVTCQTKNKRSTPAIRLGLGPGHSLEQGRHVGGSHSIRRLSTLVQTNLVPTNQPLQDATGLVSNFGFEQQNNLQPRTWRPRASGKWRGFSSQQSNRKLSRADPERSPQHPKEPEGNPAFCSRELLELQRSRSVPWPCGPLFLRNRPSSSFPGLGNTMRVSPKDTRAQRSELTPPPQSGHQDCPGQPSPRLWNTAGCWAPNPTGRPLTLKDLTPSGQCQRSAHSPVSRPRAKLSPESAHLLSSIKHLKWQTELLLRVPQKQPKPWLHSSWATSEASSALTPGLPSPLTRPCRAAPPEASPRLTPGHPSLLIDPCRSPKALQNLIPGYSPLTDPCRAVPPEATPHLTPGHPGLLIDPCRAMSPKAPKNLIPGYPSPLTDPCRVAPPEATPHLTPRHLSHHTYSSRAVPPEATPHLTPGHPSPLTDPCRAVPPEVTPHLTPRHLSHHTYSGRTVSPEATSNLSSGYPCPFTHAYRAMPPEAPPNLMPGDPSTHLCSNRAENPEVPPILTPGNLSSLSCSRTEICPNLTVRFTSSNPYSVISGSPEVPPNLTPGNLNPPTVSHSILSPVISPDLTAEHPTPFTASPKTVSPVTSLDLIAEHPTPFTISPKTVSPVISLDLTAEHPSPLTVSPKTVSPVTSLDLTAEHPSPLTVSPKTVSPVTSLDLTVGHPSPFTASPKTVSPVTSLDLTPEHPSPFSVSPNIVSPVISPDLTPRYSNLHPCSSKTTVPEASIRLMLGHPSPLPLSHRDVNPEVPASLALGCPQGVQQFPRAFGISRTQGWDQKPGTKEWGDFSLLSSGDGHDRTTPSFSPGKSGVNVFRAAKPASFPQPATAPYSALALPSVFPQAFYDKRSLPSGSCAVLENPRQTVPASPERSALPMSRDGGQESTETQLERHLQQIWEILVSLIPPGTNTPLPGPMHWRSPKEGTSSSAEGNSAQSLLKNAAPETHFSESEGRLGSRTYLSASSSMGVHRLAQQQLEVTHRPNEQKGHCMKQGSARNPGERSQNRSELHVAVGASQLELGEKSCMEEARKSRALLTRCFKAWRYHLLRQRAVARALRRRHLLRKGIRALRWSLWLRQAQIEFMKRKLGRIVLAKSFQKWKDLYLNRRERKLLTQSKTETPEKDLFPRQEGQKKKSFVTLGVVCGVEGTPKIQLHPRWKSGSQDARTPATQNLQRLAAFHLWYLQKVLAAEIRKEAHAQAELGRKKLRRVFEAWQAQTMNAARIRPLVTRHQRVQLSRCFGAWRQHTERKTWYQRRLAHWRIETLRKSLWQWVQMAWFQETYSRTVAQLYLHRQRSWHLEVAVAHERSSRGPVSQGPGEQDQPCCHPGVRAKDSLKDACQRLKLHRVVLLWSRRLAQHQQAHSYSQNRKLAPLQRWQQKAQAAESPPASSNSPQHPFVNSRDSEESSSFSGFLSSALAPLDSSAPRSSSERTHSPTDSSSSFLSLAGDEPPWELSLDLRSLSSEAPESWRISLLRVTLGQKQPLLLEWQHPGSRRQVLTYPPLGEETGALRKDARVPRDPGHLDTPWQEAWWQQGSQQALEVKQHCQITLQTRVICSWKLWAAAQGVWWELVCQQQVWGLAQETLDHWHTSWQRFQACQELDHQCTPHRPYFLKKIAFGGWTQKASMQRNVAFCQEIHFQAWHHMALTALYLWVRLWTFQAIQRRWELRETSVTRQILYLTATQGQGRADRHLVWALKAWTLDDMAEVADSQGQAWRTAMSQSHQAMHCLQRSSWAHLHSVLLSVVLKHQLAKEEKGTSFFLRPRTNAKHPWTPAIGGCYILCVDPDALGKQAGNYQTRAIGLAQTKRNPGSYTGLRKMSMSLGKEGSSDRRKYLQKWRHKISLQRFQGQQRIKRLAEVWQCWLDAQGSEQLAQTLVRQRWLQWGWGMWRRRWLQLQVAQCLQDNRVLSQAFGRWYQRWAAQVARKGSTSQWSVHSFNLSP